MAGIKIVDLPPLGRDLASTDLLELSLAGGTGSRKITGQEIMNTSKLNIGTTAITSGVVGRVLFEGAGNVVQQSSSLSYDDTAKAFTLSGNQNASTVLNVSNATSGTAANAILRLTSDSGAGYNDIFKLSTTFTTYKTLVAKDTGFYNTASGGDFSFLNDNTSGRFKIAVGASSTAQFIVQSTGNLGINTTTDAGFRLDVNGTARVQGVITGSVSSGSLTLGAASANQTALNILGYFTINGAIVTSNYNARSFNTNIGAQTVGYSSSYNGNNQASSSFDSYFLAGGSINITNGTIDLNGFAFGPSITSETNATIKAFSSSLAAASNRWNLYLSGTAKNYIAGNVLIGSTTDDGFKLDVNGTARVQGNVTLNAQNAVLNSYSTNSSSSFSVLSVLNTNTIGGFIINNGTGESRFGSFRVAGGYYTTFYVNNAELIRLSTSNNVLINTTTDAGYKLDVNGTARVSAPNGFTMVYDSNGVFNLNGLYSRFDLLNASGSLRARISNEGPQGTLTLYQNATGYIFLNGAASGNNSYIATALSIGNQSAANASSILELTSTTKGFLPPRMTQAQRNAIPSPAIGLEIYQTDATEGKYIYKSSGWTYIG